MSDTTRTQETLAKHRRKSGIRDGKRHCHCGWSSTGMLADELHEQHLAAMLAPLFAEARAEGAREALTQAATDAKARSAAFHATMLRMADGDPADRSPGDMTRYGAYSAEANCQADILARKATTE